MVSKISTSDAGSAIARYTCSAVGHRAALGHSKVVSGGWVVPVLSSCDVTRPTSTGPSIQAT